MVSAQVRTHDRIKVTSQPWLCGGRRSGSFGLAKKGLVLSAAVHSLPNISEDIPLWFNPQSGARDGEFSPFGSRGHAVLPLIPPNWYSC